MFKKFLNIIPKDERKEDFQDNSSTNISSQDVKLPEVLRYDGQKIYCMVCKQNILKGESADGHVEGPLHKFYLQFHRNISEAAAIVSKAIHRGTLRMVTVYNAKYISGYRFQCEACSLRLEYTSLALLFGHIQCEEHKKCIITKYEESPSIDSDFEAVRPSTCFKNKNLTVISCKLCQVEISALKINNHVLTPNHKFKAKKTYESESTNRFSTFNSKDIKPEEISDGGIVEWKYGTSYFCNACDIMVTDDGEMNRLKSHVWSLSHLYAAVNHPISNTKNMEPDEALACGMVKWKYDQTYICNACDVLVTCDDLMNQGDSQTLGNLKTHLARSYHKQAACTKEDDLKNIVDQEIMYGILSFKFEAKEVIYSIREWELKARTTLRIKGLAKSVTEREIRDIFETYGEIKQITTISFASFLTFGDEETAAAAKEAYDGFECSPGHKLSIKYVNELQETHTMGNEQDNKGRNKQNNKGRNKQDNKGRNKQVIHQGGKHRDINRNAHTSSKQLIHQGGNHRDINRNAHTSSNYVSPGQANDVKPNYQNQGKIQVTQPKGMTLYVRGLPGSMPEEAIKGIFEVYGEILDITFRKGSKGINNKPFCFLKFGDIETAEAVKEAYDQFEISTGQKLTVEYANKVQETPIVGNEYQGGDHIKGVSESNTQEKCKNVNRAQQDNNYRNKRLKHQGSEYCEINRNTHTSSNYVSRGYPPPTVRNSYGNESDTYEPSQAYPPPTVRYSYGN